MIKKIFIGILISIGVALVTIFIIFIFQFGDYEPWMPFIRGFKKDKVNYNIITFGVQNTINYWPDKDTSYEMGGYILIYGITNDILYWISDDLRKHLNRPYERYKNNEYYNVYKIINIKDRYLKMNLEVNDIGYWDNIEEIPIEERLIYIAMEKELSNWLQSGRVELDDRGIVVEYKIIQTNEEGIIETNSVVRGMEYYNMTNLALVE